MGVPPEEAASSHVAETVARKVDVEDLHPSRSRHLRQRRCQQARGLPRQGAGYSDIEFALLQEAALLRPETAIVATVHPL